MYRFPFNYRPIGVKDESSLGLFGMMLSWDTASLPAIRSGEACRPTPAARRI